MANEFIMDNFWTAPAPSIVPKGTSEITVGLNSAYNDFQAKKKAYNKSLRKARRTFWWNSLDKEDLLLIDAEDAGLEAKAAADVYNNRVKELGLEGIAPSIEDFSQETLDKTILKTAEQSAANRSDSISKTFEYTGLAADALTTQFTKDPKAYEGDKGSVTQGLDSAGDALANAAMASRNPYAMAAAAAYKVMGFANRAIGGGTDGMTGIDAALDSNLGFIATGGLSKLNGALGMTTDKFEVDQDLQAAMGSSYLDTYGDLEGAESKAGKRYGFLSKGKARKAQNEIHMANLRLDVLSDINETALDRIAAGGYEGIGLRNLTSLTGGFKNTRAARKGIKMNLDFAHKIVKALSGHRFNVFTPVEPLVVLPDVTNTYGLVPTILESNEYHTSYPGMTEMDLATLGVVYKEIDSNGNLVYSAPSQNVVDTLTKNTKLISNLTRKYGVSGIRFEVNTSSSNEQLSNSQSTLQPPPSSSGSSPSLGGLPLNPPVNIGINPEGWSDKLVMFNMLQTAYIGRSTDYDYLLNIVKQLLNLGYCADSDPRVILNSFLDYMDALNSSLTNGTYSTGLGPLTLEIEKLGGILTFTPYTDEQVNKFKAGGSFNVIPDGALHKNRHNMEGAEGLTKKGIPVVTEEDGKKVQQAEIEVNEIIFRLEVTEKLEKLAKEGTDEAALEAGKLITEEILRNTHDNTGLIEETV